jgi:hypothetical protein
MDLQPVTASQPWAHLLAGARLDPFDRVVARYGLTGTTAPYNGHWDVTLSTASDLVRYYDMLWTAAVGGRPNRPT